MSEDEFAPVISNILNQYPALSGHNWAARRGDVSQYGGSLEFFNPDEPTNPYPGRPTIEVYDKNLTGDALQRAVFGDMLHYMPQVDPKFRDFREQFRGSLTPEQREFDRRKYNQLHSSGKETRSYDDWMDRSWLDAYIRGYLAPDERDEWRKSGTYTDKQTYLLEAMRHYLAQPRK